MIKYSLKGLLSKKTISILFAFAILIAMSISMLSINITSQIEEGFYQADKKYDVIIGPAGSSTQLVMSSLFFSEDPLGTFDSSYEERIKNEYSVDRIIPLAIADYYNGNRIVGTDSLLLEGYSLYKGALFENSFEIVIGYAVAERYNLSLGDLIVTSHGVGAFAEEHDHSPYTVVGILDKTNTSYDNTLFTTLDSVYEAHNHSEHDDESHEEGDEDYDDHEADDHSHDDEHEHSEHDHNEYTALLIRTGNMAVANKLESDFSDDSSIQVVNTTQILRKLMNNVDVSKGVALLLCGIIVILAIILIIVMSFLMVINLKKDIDLLEFLGMKKRKIYSYVLWQIVILLVISTVLSLGMNRVVLNAANSVSSQMGIVLDITKVYPKEIYSIAIYIVIIVISTIAYVYTQTKSRKK